MNEAGTTTPVFQLADAPTGILSLGSGSRRAPRIRIQGFLLAAMVLAFLVVGCQSTRNAPSDRLACVTIQDRTQAQVEAATTEVFKQHSYEGEQTGPGQFKFERPGSKWDQAAYGGWIDPNVWRRVLVTVKPLDDRTVLVDCDAYIVRFHGDRRFEEVQELGWRHRGAYQDLLNEIRGRFKWLPVAE